MVKSQPAEHKTIGFDSKVCQTQWERNLFKLRQHEHKHHVMEMSPQDATSKQQSHMIHQHSCRNGQAPESLTSSNMCAVHKHLYFSQSLRSLRSSSLRFSVFFSCFRHFLCLSVPDYFTEQQLTQMNEHWLMFWTNRPLFIFAAANCFFLIICFVCCLT